MRNGCDRGNREKKKRLMKIVAKNLGVDTFPNPVDHFGIPGGHFRFQGYPPFLIEGVLV